MFKIGQGSRPCRATTIYQKVEIFDILGATFPPRGNWGEILHSQADPRARRPCQVWRESVQWVAPAGGKPDFWPVSKFKTGSLPLRGILPVKTRNKSITSKAIQYRQDIVTRMPIRWTELITNSIVTIRSIWHSSASDFLRFGKFLPQIWRILCCHLPTGLRNV